MREIGLGKGSAEELVDKGITRVVFPHGLGHSLGVTVHDVGMKPRPPRRDNKFLRNTSVIEAGQADRKHLVDWALVDELHPFGGIRIEDNVVVEANGTRNLTREAFASA